MATLILGPFRLDAETDTLFRDGEPVSLGHRAVALLRVLVERPGIPRLQECTDGRRVVRSYC
jgi:DNA-binding winged helix-turn-helix (wHTH) protein